MMIFETLMNDSGWRSRCSVSIIFYLVFYTNQYQNIIQNIMALMDVTYKHFMTIPYDL
jgi:hypothetical protein